MTFRQTVNGQRLRWGLGKKLGEGDAGEVFLVESLLDGKPAILKRPRSGAFTSDIFRQAAQIKTEAAILSALNGFTLPEQGTRVEIPALLDQSPVEDSTGERFFIVIERAAGISLKSIWQIIRYGLLDELNFSSNEEDRVFLEWLSRQGGFPEPLLIRALASTLALLETIHNSEVRSEQTRYAGVLWNDIKAEHLYWSPIRASLTVIDWGNSQFLEADGASRDRQFSRLDDYTQFLQEMGAFLSEISPNLFARLDWRSECPHGDIFEECIQPLLENLNDLNKEVSEKLRELRSNEQILYSTTRPDMSHLLQNDELGREILTFGELPDISSAVNLHARVALQMAVENRYEEFQQVCRRAAKLAGSSGDKWKLLAEIAGIAQQQDSSQEDAGELTFANALAAGVADDWSSLLWELFTSTGSKSLPPWWDAICRGVRESHLKVDSETPTPGVAINRLYYALQSSILEIEDKHLSLSTESADISPEHDHRYRDFLKIFKEEVVDKWKEIEPAPPHSGIEYNEINGMIDEIEVVLPGTQADLEKVFAQPKAQVAIVMGAWERKDFELARKGLQKVLFWDPERRRLIKADRSIAAAPQWLARIRKGPASDEPFYNYLSAIELSGRSLRNSVGAATWLDLILEALRRLRKGTRSADLIMEHPELLSEIPWLNEYRSREILSLPRTRPLALERDEVPLITPRLTSREAEGRLGPEGEISLAEPLDTWASEARGSSARVFAGMIRKPSGQRETYAIKIMRPESVEYALPLFREEAQILSLLRDIPGISPLVECGFLKLDEGSSFPNEERHTSAAQLCGQVVRLGVDEVQNFLASVDRYISAGWLPYLALVRRDNEHNLLKYCDAGYNHGWFLPLRESLILSIQICDILQSAHERNIVYRDHKILHYYWDQGIHGVVMIDWNIARRAPQGLSETERQFDLAQFGARALHHILTGRPAAGALPLGPNRPEDIERASLSYNVNWTYDDERLPNRIKEILEHVLNQGYSYIRDLRNDLGEVYNQIPDAASGVERSNP